MTEQPVAMLWAGQVWTIPAFVRRVHPSNPDPLPADVTQAFRLPATPLHPHGGES